MAPNSKGSSIPWWCSGWGFVLDAEMFEVAGYFTAVCDGCQNGHVAFALLTLSHIDPKDFSEHFAPAGVFKGNVLGAGIFG